MAIDIITRVRTMNMRATWHALFNDVRAEKDEGHVNALKFKGVLLLLDEASQKPPNGSHGHKILIPKEVAQKNLHTLIGMGIDYEDSFDKHNPKKKVGVIQKAWIVGNKLMCSGIIWKKDFPDVKEALDDKQLGMSFEGSNISVEDPKAEVWKITDVCFTGAAILYKTAAAYQKTEALAAAADHKAICAELVYIHKNNGGKAMSTKAKKVSRTSHGHGRRSVSAGSGETDLVKVVAKTLQTALKPMSAALATQTAALAAMSASFEDFSNEQLELLATGAPGMLGKKGKKKGSSSSSSESDSQSSEEAASASSAEASAASSASSASESSAESKGGVAAKKKMKSARAAKSHKDEYSGSSASSSAEASAESQKAGASSDASDASSLEDMDESDSVDSESEAPGHLNKHANKNKGNKTKVSTHGDKHPKAEAGLHASSSKNRKLIRRLLAEREERASENKHLRRKVKKLEAQADAGFMDTDRRSVPHVSGLLSGLLQKGAIDISTLSASGEKISLDEFNTVLDKVPSIGSTQRMALKAEAARAGILEEGVISK